MSGLLYLPYDIRKLSIYIRQNAIVSEEDLRWLNDFIDVLNSLPQTFETSLWKGQ